MICGSRHLGFTELTDERNHESAVDRILALKKREVIDRMTPANVREALERKGSEVEHG